MGKMCLVIASLCALLKSPRSPLFTFHTFKCQCTGTICVDVLHFLVSDLGFCA